MENCFIQTFKGKVTDYTLPGYKQQADFAESLEGVSYDIGTYWHDQEEIKVPYASTIIAAIDPIKITGVRNGFVVRCKSDSYEFSKIAVKSASHPYENGTLTNPYKMLIVDLEDTISVYITLKKIDGTDMDDSIDLSEVIEIVSQYPMLQPNVYNPLIEADYVASSASEMSAIYDRAQVGEYVLVNYAASTSGWAYNILRCLKVISTFVAIADSREKTVKFNDKYYRFNGSVWAEIVV